MQPVTFFFGVVRISISQNKFRSLLILKLGIVAKLRFYGLLITSVGIDNIRSEIWH